MDAPLLSDGTLRVLAIGATLLSVDKGTFVIIEEIDNGVHPSRGDNLVRQIPKLIIEVLSESTEAFDRGDKFADYRTLESLEEYVLISTKHQRVECFRRNEQGLWVLHFFTSEQKVFQVNSINFESSFDLLYEDITWQP